MTPRYILFDFFGTLVGYTDGVNKHAFDDTLGLLAGHGVHATQADLRAALDAAFADLEREIAHDLSEFHNEDAMARMLHHLAADAEHVPVTTLGTTFIADWSRGIVGLEGLGAALSRIHLPKAVVSNTHTPRLVEDTLDRHRLDHHFEDVVTSIGVGVRKPHERIYEAALEIAGCRPEEVLFIGDNAECDFHGPRRYGMQALWISPEPDPSVSEDCRLSSVLELPARLAALGLAEDTP